VRTGIVLPLAALVIAVVLSLAVWTLQRDRQRLLADFARAQEDVAGQLAKDLSGKLEDLDSDARLVVALVHQADNKAVMDAADVRASVLSGFEALATVVRHYRALMLFRDRKLSVMAVDPTEPSPTEPALVVWASEAARALDEDDRRTLHGPREGRDGRQYFVYAQPVGTSEDAVVLISEARLLLQPVLRSRDPKARYFLVDPSGSIWVGCAQPSTCRAFTRNEWPSIPGLDFVATLAGKSEGTMWTEPAVPSAFGLPGRAAAVSWQPVSYSDQSWTIGIVASAQNLEIRERSLLRRLVATSAALIFTLGLLSALVVRQQKRAAALRERLRHAQEVAHLRERTERLVENVSAGFIGVTKEGRVALTNRFLAERVLAVPHGASVAEILGEHDVDSAARFSAALDLALRTGRPGYLPGSEIRAFANRPGHFDLRIIPLKQPAEDVAALLLVDDLSELKSLEKQLVRAEKLGTVGVLAAGLAHEIGTPLGIIRGRAEVLLEKNKDPSITKDLDSVIRQIDQIGTVIRQVLDFARTQPVEMRAVNAHEAIEAAVTILEWRLRQKEIVVRIEAPIGVPSIAADPDQFQQVLVNLLINACDACQHKGTIRIDARAADPRDRVIIEITDDGCGIPAEDLNAVFDPFFTTKKRGEGTGLGLPVAASIVRNHHGDISLISREGEGTTVTIVWPARVETLVAATGAAEEPAEPAGSEGVAHA
jgi:two-component system sensor histidine kinase HydH